MDEESVSGAGFETPHKETSPGFNAHHFLQTRLPPLRPFSLHFVIVIPEVAPKWCCGSSSPADPEIGVSAPGGGGAGAPATAQAPKSGRVKRMVRLAAELLLLLGLLLLTLHITVLRSSPLPQGNVTASLDQDAALTEVSEGIC